MSTDPLDRSLLPRSATARDGRLSIGGVDLVELAEEHGTPLYVYDEAELRERARAYRNAFGDAVAYAGKAALFRALIRIVADEGLHLDVASGGELAAARSAGYPPDRVLFHGNNKSTEELTAALDAGVGRIVVDSDDELDRVEALVAAGHPAPRVLVRVTPGVEARTHEAIETGTDASKFGFALRSGAALTAACRVAAGPATLLGLHCHIGSQVLHLEAYRAAALRMAALVHAVESSTGADVEELNLGGGLGVRYVAGDVAPDVGAYADVVRVAVREALEEVGARSRPRLFVEPGRSIVAPAGITLYRVGTVKPRDDGSAFVAVDGGMSDNPRPALYGARYEAFLPGRVDAPRDRAVTVAGKHCEQGDLLVPDGALPADVRVGDVLAVPVTGAYALSMASNYNRLPRPAVVMVAEGRARLVVRRETVADLERLDIG